jgi:predicted Zn-dependent peptidase
MEQNRFTLQNGLKVIHYFLPATKSVTISLMLKTGSFNEKRNEYGMAHFLEHTLGESTVQFPDEGNKQIMLESHGIIENAWTSKNITNYFLKTPTVHFSLACKVLFDRVFSAIFKEESIQKQKAIILEEIKMRKDNPVIMAWNNLSQQLFQDSNLSHPTIGTSETVENFTLETLTHFHEHNYSIDKMLLWVGGNIDAETVKKVLQKLSIPSTNKNVNKKKDTSVYRKGNKESISFQEMDIQNYYVILGFNGFSILQKNLLESVVAGTILGAGRGSILYNALRIKQSLVSDIGTELECYLQDGILYTLFATNKEKVLKALSTIVDEINKLNTKRLTSDMIKRSKNMIRSYLLKHEESAEQFIEGSSALNFVQKELLTGKTVNFQEEVQKIQNCTKKDILESIFNKINYSHAGVSIVGKQKISFDLINETLQKLRSSL